MDVRDVYSDFVDVYVPVLTNTLMDFDLLVFQ